jgi:hypothetical protein
MDERSGPAVLDRPTAEWCDCDDAPLYATGASTLLDHPGGCEFPVGICTIRAHRITVHAACGRPLRMRFCGCAPSGYSYDRKRGWWVHYICGWPTRAWYEQAGKPASEHLAGARPVTYHEFADVPKPPKKGPDPLGAEQRARNTAYTGRWVRD